MANTKFELLNQRLTETYGVSIFFTEKSLKDFKSYDAYNKNIILKMLAKQASKDPRLKSEGGLGTNCDSPLHHFAKIKYTSANLRIIYRPVNKKGLIHMEIIATGPRSDLEVYRLAERRLKDFYRQYGE